MLHRSRVSWNPSQVSARWRSPVHQKIILRSLTKDTHSLLLSHQPLRPQLPHLRGSRLQFHSHHPLRTRIGELLKSEQSKDILAQVKLLTWAAAIFVTVFALYKTAAFGVEQGGLEQQWPSPEEWSFFTRAWFRLAKNNANPKSLVTEYSPDEIGKYFLWALRRLENTSKDGKSIKPVFGEGEEIYVDGIGKTGMDITKKSEEWRRGYHEVLMGAAKAAEQLDGWVWDKKQSISVPRDVVVGPSNPQPKPMPSRGKGKPPREEDCQERAYEPPEIYYMKILTTQGFMSRQKLDAALAYADWLEYSGLRSSAEDMYSWALDIATATYPQDYVPINKKTAVINANIKEISNNVLLTASAIAGHRARTSDHAAALPIYLSVLRAQQSLPPADATIFSHSSAELDTSTFFGLVRAFFTPPEYGPSPPTGDEPATRTPANVCAEAGTMARIGEILFASSPLIYSQSASPSPDPDASQTAGLSWTRDAVDLAESTFRSLPSVGNNTPHPLLTDPSSTGPVASGLFGRAVRNGSPAELEAKDRCSECMLETLRLWRKMLRMLDDQEIAAVEAKGAKGSSGWVSRIWGGKSGSNAETVEDVQQVKVTRWMGEDSNVGDREAAVRRLLRQEGISA